MLIQGLQKLTLLDFPGRVACTVFLGGCDFRCPFCHNSTLIAGGEAVMDDAALLSFLKKRQGLLDGVAFTGGEPLLRRDLAPLLREIRALGFEVKMDTNGNHPDVLKALVGEGLIDYVAMDIKNSPEKYAVTIGLEQFDISAVEESLAFLKTGTVDYELRTTAVAEYHTDEDFRAIARWIEGADHYFIQCYTERDSVLCHGLTAPTEEALRRWCELVRPFVGEASVRGAAVE
ncbi:MAG: anaerobic ribonucleoside-triphosphate reductase activating protein [Oscillospiraceae bacterium]|nr:anaerobic ribonucleoside-triphosphate reductase activating protein [Oscillospiraceae bacterium]